MRSLTPVVAASALYILITTVLTWPLALHLGDRVVNDLGDPLLNTWIIAWNSRATPLTADWWNAPQFYPVPGATAFSEHLLGLWPLTAPIITATGKPLFAYNVAFFLSFPLCALAGHVFGWTLTRRHDAALVAGLAFGFAPYRAAQLPHIQVLSAYWMPLALAGLHHYLADRRVRWLLLFGVAWVMQALTCGYYFFYLSVLIVLWLLWFMLERGRWRDLLRVMGVWVLAAVLLAPVIYGYWKFHQMYGLQRPPHEIASFSADLASVLRASPNLQLWGWLNVFDRPEGEIFPGLTIVLLIVAGVSVASSVGNGARRGPRLGPVFALFGIVLVLVAGATVVFGPWKFEIAGLRILSVGAPHRAWWIGFALLTAAAVMSPSVRAAWTGRSVLAFYVIGAVTMWILSLGPTPTFLGQPIGYQGPYAWLMELPGVSGVRVPARFWMLGVVCLAAAGAVAFARLATRWARLRVALLAAVCIGILLDGWYTRLSLLEPPERRPNRTSASARIDLPLTSDPVVLYRSIFHKTPIVNGASGYFAPHYEALQYLLEQHVPDVLTQVAQFGDLEIVVDHERDTDERWRQFVASYPGAERVHVSNSSTSYRIRQSPTRRQHSRIEGPSLSIATMTATVSPEKLPYLTDGDLVSRWDAGRGQEPGDGLTLDLGRPQPVRAVELDLGRYASDFPRTLRIETSEDGVIWREVWSGPTGIVALTGALEYPRSVPLTFEIDRPARYLRLTQLGSDFHYWSIAELRVIGE